jgi:hypothetical protein
VTDGGATFPAESACHVAEDTEAARHSHESLREAVLPFILAVGKLHRRFRPVGNVVIVAGERVETVTAGPV